MTGVEEAALIAAVAPEVIGGAEVAGVGAAGGLGAGAGGAALGAGLPAAGALGGLEMAAPEVVGFAEGGAPIMAGDLGATGGLGETSGAYGTGGELLGFPPPDFPVPAPSDYAIASARPEAGAASPWYSPGNLMSTENLQKGVMMGLLGQMGGSLFKGNQPNVRPPPQASIPQITHRPREVQPTALHQLAYLQAQQNMRRNKPGMFG